MGRRTEKTDCLSQEILGRLNVFCRGNLVWLYRECAEFQGLGIQNFYAAMRGDYCTPDNIQRFENLDRRLQNDGTYESLKAFFPTTK